MTTPFSAICSTKVEGTNVYDTAGDKLGSIDDLMIDRYTEQVRYAVLKFGGFLGMEPIAIQSHGPCSSLTKRSPVTWYCLTKQSWKNFQNTPTSERQPTIRKTAIV